MKDIQFIQNNMKAIIFDFDGVIVNSKGIQKSALKESYQKCVGIGDPPYEAFFKLSGSSLNFIFETLNLPLEMILPYREYSMKHINDVKIFSGIDEVLIMLYEKGIKLGLCTGKDRERTLQILECLGIIKYFSCIVCSDDVENPKPDTESLDKCTKELKISKNNACMVGDSVNDILCAKNAGVKCIGVTWGEGTYEDLLCVEPNYLVGSMSELYHVIFGMISNEYYE